MEITVEQLKQISPSCKNPEEFVAALNKWLPLYQINTVERVSCFLGQYLHETSGFTKLVENTNYTSVERLQEIFPTKFTTIQIAASYAGKPVAIANRVYANRYGNGDEVSGDGYKYRGRGLCHLTFKDNYRACGADLKIDILAHPELLESPDIAVLVGCWYWQKNSLNGLADKDQFKTMTKIINGGYNGLENRISYRDKSLTVLRK